MRKRVLVTEPIAASGLELLREAYDVHLAIGASPGELAALLAPCHGLVVRSATRVTADLLAAVPHLEVIGRAGAGVDNIDLEAATRRGVIVVNAPGSNTVAVAEHTIALMLCLARPICEANAAMHAGCWNKQGLMGTELRGKTLGVVGFGRVGTAVAQRARALEMTVLAHDPFVAPERAAQLQVELLPLEDLLRRADYVSLHAPLTARTRGLIDARRLALLKPGARLINCARGELVVEADLVRALREGYLAGAALDVVADEPAIAPELCACPNLLLTPHLGASTSEAQDQAAVEVARQVDDVLAGRSPRYPVNLAALAPEELARLHPYLDLAERLGRILAHLAPGNMGSITVTLAGEAAGPGSERISAAALAGILTEASDEPANVVNALIMARERGLAVREVRSHAPTDLAGLVTIEAEGEAGRRTVAGSVLRGQPHVMRVDDYWFDFVADGPLLVSEHIEQPGIIGQMGTILGEGGIDIAFLQVGRQRRGGRGMMVLGIDRPPDERTMARVMAMPSVRSARVISL